MTNEERKTVYFFVFGISLGILFSTGFLIDALMVQIRFSSSGKIIPAKVIGIKRIGGEKYEYNVSYRIYNDYPLNDVIQSYNLSYNLGDSVKIYYLMSGRIGWASDLRNRKTVLILTGVDLLLIIILIAILKRPKILLKYKATLDQW